MSDDFPVRVINSGADSAAIQFELEKTRRHAGYPPRDRIPVAEYIQVGDDWQYRWCWMRMRADNKGLERIPT